MRRATAVTGRLAVTVLTLVALSACSVSGASQGGGGSDNYPDGPIEVVVTYEAGGASDQLARNVAPAMGDDLGQTMVVENEPGGAGTVGVTSVTSAEPDGYRLGFVAGGPLTVQPHYGMTEYEYDDIVPVARVATAPLLLVVRSDAPWDTVGDLVDHLESGEEFKYASSGTGNPANVAMEKFDMAAGVDTSQVPFEGSGQVASALLGGNVDAAAGLPSSFAASVESGDLKVLANLGNVKTGFYSEAQTLEESGYDAITNISNGIVAPPDTDPAIVETLAGSVETALEEPEVAERIEAAGFTSSYADGQEYGEELDREYEEMGQVLDRLGLLDE